MEARRQLHVFQADLGNRAHAEAVRDLVNAYAREPVGHSADLPDDALERLVPGLREHPTTLVFLAYDERPVGIAVCFRSFSTFAARPTLNVHDLFVVADRRGLGVAQRLLEAVESCARALGCCALTLEVREDNQPAHRLYRRLGFADAGPRRYWFWKKAL